MQTLDQWILEVWNQETDEDKGPLTRFSLMHQKGISQEEVHSVPIGTSKKWNVKELASLFQRKAETHAEQLSGVQTFYLLAFYSGRTEPQARKPFRINAQTDLLESMGGTEGPTGTGLTQQAMRHMESVYQLAIKQSAFAFEAQSSALQTQAQTIKNLNSELTDARDIAFKLMMQQMDRQHEFRMKELAYERSSKERSKLLGQAPALVNTIFGREIFPQASEDSALLDAVAEEMDEKKIMALMQSGLLSPKLMGLLGARMEKYLSKANEEDEKKERVGNGINVKEELQ